jgi:hypothetical protein
MDRRSGPSIRSKEYGLIPFDELVAGYEADCGAGGFIFEPCNNFAKVC